MKKRLLVLAASLALTACSTFTPHQIALNPVLEMQQTVTADSVKLNIEDRRRSPILGTRVSRFEKSAFVSLSQNPEAALHQALSKALKARGLKVESQGNKEFTLYLDQLDYKATQQSLLQKVELTMKVSVRLSRNGETYTGSYQSAQSHEFVRTPDLETNTRIINAITEKTLNRALNDPRLINFLRYE